MSKDLTTKTSDIALIPTHVAIIMDGNGRWAEKRGKPRIEGHRQGARNLKNIVTAFHELGVQFLTVYAFSTENWRRPQKEVDGLLELLLESVEDQLDSLNESRVRIKHLGDKKTLSPEVRTAIATCEEITDSNDGLTLNVAFNYGGRAEIIRAVKALVKDKVDVSQISNMEIEKRLYTHGMPDPDLIIRTAGEKRLSNFLVWQSAYAEYYYSDCFWPDFDQSQINKAIQSYQTRRRKFGRLDV